MTAFSQQQGSVPRDVLEQLKFMAGSWKEENLGGGGPATTLKHERIWSPGKHCLIVEWKGIFNGVTVHATGVAGWDNERKEIAEHWFMSDGTYFHTAYPVADVSANEWAGTSSWIGSNGRRVTASCKLEKKGKDEFVWTARWKENGEDKSSSVRNTRVGELISSCVVAIDAVAAETQRVSRAGKSVRRVKL
jgi:hypothetical protein